MEFPNAIALTGGIATGKSSVCSLLQLYGFKIIDADKVAHKMLDQSTTQIADLFGSHYIVDGKVDRKSLGNLIFSNEPEREKLETLLHPLIKEDIHQQSMLCENKNIPYIVDIPLFFEKRNYPINEVILIYCQAQQQIDRLQSRESYSLEEAQSRINAQMPIDVKKDKASFIIDNTKNLKHLQSEVDSFVGYIKQKYPALKI